MPKYIDPKTDVVQPSEVQEYFESLRPGRFLHGKGGEVGAERAPGAGEIQPAGWVVNADGNVIIDKSGIIIEDGALTFRDAFGENVLTGGGFGTSWAKFITHGVYNGDFALGVDNDIFPTGVWDEDVLPYWTSRHAGSDSTATVQADAGYSGGKAVQLLIDSTGTSEERITVDQNTIMVAGERYLATVRFRVEDASALKPATCSVYFIFYDADGIEISNSLSTRSVVGGFSPGEWRSVVSSAETVPANTATVSIQASLYYEDGGDAGWIALMDGVSIIRLASRSVAAVVSNITLTSDQDATVGGATSIGNSLAEHDAAWRAAYPGNPVMPDTFVTMEVFANFSFQWGAVTTDFDIELSDTGGTVYGTFKGSASVAGEYQTMYVQGRADFDATDAKTFRIRFKRTAGASNLSILADGVIGYRVLGYHE